MVRSTSLTTIAANDAAQWFILVDVADIPTTLNLTTGDDQATDFSAYRAWLSQAAFSIGPSLDWRGGLAADDPFTIKVVQGFDSADGTTGNNTFERLFALYDSEAYSGTYREATILNGGSGSVAVKLGSYNGTPTGVSTTIYTGITRNLALTDYDALMLEIGRGNRWLDKTFLSRLGREPSGQENYDTVLGRDIVPQSEGRPVPISYGRIPYAEGLFVHEGNTSDDTERSGLILCYSDIRFDTAQTYISAGDPYLFVYDGATDEFYDVMPTDYESGTSGQTQYDFMFASGAPESNLVLTASGGSASATGYFVRFLDASNNADGDAVARFAGGGRILIRRQAALVSANANPFDTTWTVGTPTFLWTNHTDAANDDPPSSASTTSSVYSTFQSFSVSPASPGTTNTYGRYYSWMVPQITSRGSLYRVFLLPLYVHSGTAGAQNTAAFLKYTSNRTSYDYTTSALTNITTASFNAWTSTGSPFKMAWAFNEDDSPSGLAGNAYIGLGINATSGLVGQTNVYGADIQIIWEEDWREYRNKIYAAVQGVRDNTYEFTSGTDQTLRNPAEVFYHFVEEVCGGSAYTASSHLSDVATDMDGDSLLCDVQLVDGDKTAADQLDDFALQFMSWVVPADDGSLKLIYRASTRNSFLAYDEIVDTSKVIKGTVSTHWTDHDELYAGVIVNYAWNAARQRFDEQWAITPTAHEIETNVTSATDYQGLSDAVRSDVEKVLEIDAYMIQDADTAELLCKWLMQQHCRRRQIIEFETTLELFDIEVGDRLIVDLPHTRVYCSGDTATAVDDGFGLPGTVNLDAATTKWPSGATLNRTVHLGDIMIIENSSPGYVYIKPDGSGGVDVGGYESGAIAVGSTNPFRVVPSFHVLDAKVVYDNTKGPRMRFRVIEAPIIRAGATSI